MKIYKICIAGLGNIGSEVIKNLNENQIFISNKRSFKYFISGITAKDKSKKRSFNIKDYNWYNDPLELIEKSNSDILIELIGTEKGISYDLIKKALNKKMHVITANKALLANYGNELFKLAESNNVLLLYEAAVAGGIPIVRTIKQSLFLNKILKISGIFNGTTNFILTEMAKTNSNFYDVLKIAQEKGYAEADPKNDIEGIDAAHKLSILSVLCYGVTFNFNNIIYKGISKISNQDIFFADKLGYKIKLLGTSEIINNKIINVVEPTLIQNSSKLSRVEGVQNGIIIKTDYLESLFIEGEGAGGKATASSIISDLMEIIDESKVNSLGYNTKQLREISFLNYDEKVSPFYLRIVVKDLPGVLANITSNLNEEGISIETILQLPENNNKALEVPIIITTHETKANLLKNSLKKIEKLDYVTSKIIFISIDRNID